MNKRLTYSFFLIFISAMAVAGAMVIRKKSWIKYFSHSLPPNQPSGGTGLGISLTYDIITKGLGGELNVETNEG